MKNQILNSNCFFINLNQKFEIVFKLFIDEILLLTMFITTIITVGLPTLSIIIGSITFPIIMIITFYKLIDYQKLKIDIKKNLLFIKNEDNLNTIIRNNPKIINKLISKRSNKFIFTLNTIDKIKYKELKHLYNTVSNNKNKTLKKDIHK